MISKPIYFIDAWVKANNRLGTCDSDADPGRLAEQCVDDAAKAGISGAELEEDGISCLNWLIRRHASCNMLADIGTTADPEKC
jgi:hypothetical protein